MPYLAAKITESQVHLLRPVFGEEGVFGLTVMGARALVTQQRKRPPLVQAPIELGMKNTSTETIAKIPTAYNQRPFEVELRSGTLDSYLRNLHEEVVGELHQQFTAMYTHMFDPVLVRNGVAQFYDSIVVDKIQMKASRLLNENIQVKK